MEPTKPRHNLNPQLAKKMVESYQATFTDPNSIRAMTFDADEVRDYLSDHSIKSFVVFLAHTDEWAQSHFGVANSTMTTSILVGTDGVGNGIPNSSGSVLDYSDLCPSHCANSGNVIFDNM